MITKLEERDVSQTTMHVLSTPSLTGQLNCHTLSHLVTLLHYSYNTVASNFKISAQFHDIKISSNCYIATFFSAALMF